MLDELRLEVVEHLRSLFPTSLRSFYRDAVQHDADEIIRVITMGQKYQMLEILPAAYLLCFRLPLETILDGATTTKNGQSKTHRLPPEELRRYLLARERIFSLEHNVFSFLLSEPSECMLENESCRRALQCLTQNSIIFEWFRDSSAVYADQYLDPQVLLIGNEKMCPDCTEWWKKSLKEQRVRFWRELPALLSLPDWHTMRAAAAAK